MWFRRSLSSSSDGQALIRGAHQRPPRACVPMTTHRTVIRAALVVALLTLAAVLGWVAWTKLSSRQGGADIVLLVALFPLAAAGLLILGRNGGAPAVVGGVLGFFAALLGALVGLALAFCFLCGGYQPPLGVESIALWFVAVVVLALALADLGTVGLAWAPLVITAVILAGSGGGVLIAAVIIAPVVVWWILKRRKPGGGSPVS